jgi:hypothetical protein
MMVSIMPVPRFSIWGNTSYADQEYGHRQGLNHLRAWNIEVPIARSQEKKLHFAARSHTEAARLCARDRYNSGSARKLPQKVAEAVCCRALLSFLIAGIVTLLGRNEGRRRC